MADKKKKKTTPKATRKNRKPTAKKTSAKKTVVSKKSNKTTVQKRAARQNNLKHSDADEKLTSKSRKKEDKIVINLVPKKAQKAMVTPSKNVAKQVTEQLPDSAKLKTIHLHFRID